MIENAPSELSADLSEFEVISELIGLGAQAAVHGAFFNLAERCESMLHSPRVEDKHWLGGLIDFLDTVDIKLESVSQARALLAGAQVLYMTGDFGLALRASRRAGEITEAGWNLTDRRRALNIQGVSHSQLGEHAEAIEKLTAALDLAQALEDRFAESAVLLNIAAVMGNICLFEDAIRLCEHVLTAFEGSISREQMLQSYGNIATCALRLEQYEKGFEAAQQYLAVAAVPITPAELARRLAFENTFVWILLRSGRAHLARERLPVVERLVAQCALPGPEVHALIVRALYEAFVSGSTAAAQELSRQVLRKAMDSPLYLDGLTALEEIYRHLDQPVNALVYIRLLQDHLAETHGSAIARVLTAVRERSGVAIGGGLEGVAQARERAASLAQSFGAEPLQAAQREVLESWAMVAEFRQNEGGKHAYRVGRLVGLTARACGLDPGAADAMELAARLHDIGEICLPASLWNRSGELGAEETAIFARHGEIGATLIGSGAAQDEGYVWIAAQIARHHHERWDGTGYPDGLAGEAIPLGARITAVADHFDRLTNARRGARSDGFSHAIADLQSLKGAAFDPDVVEAFIAVVTRLHDEHGESLHAYLARDARASKLLSSRERALAASVPDGGRRRESWDAPSASDIAGRRLAYELATGIGQELNQPLSAALSYAQYCLNQAKSSDAGLAKMGEALQAAEKQLLRAGDVLRSMRARFSLPRHASEPTDLNALLAEILRDRDVDWLSGIELAFSPAPALPPACANRDDLHIALSAIIKNGCEATQRLGHRMLVVTTGRDASGMVFVEVVDNGAGFSQDAAERLFDHFHTTKRYGLGIGLAMAKTIAETHGGQLSARALSPGAAFRMQLPGCG